MKIKLYISIPLLTFFTLLMGHGSLSIQDIVREIDPVNPDQHLIEDFQRATMGMKPGDPGYGRFGPKTTAKWKEIKNNMDSQNIKTSTGLIG